MPPKGKVSLLPTSDEILKTKRLMEELELKKLTRQDRLMREIKTKDATTETQKKVIDVLSNERDDLVKNLTVMRSDRQYMKENKQTNDVAQLFGQGDRLDMQIEEEKKFIKDLEAQIRKTSVQVDYHRKNVKSNVLVSEFRLVEENQRAARLKSSLESKLHAEQVQLNTMVQENAELRQKIRVLIKEKSQFNLLFEEMMQKLTRGKKIMTDVALQSKSQFAQRNEMARKIQALKNRDLADLQKRKGEMQDLVMKRSEDSELAVFKKRVTTVREKLSEGLKATMKVDATRAQHERNLEMMVMTWEKLKSVTGLDHCKEVCDLVVKQEQENFSLFSYNNELHHQLEALTEKTAELMRQVEDGQVKADNQVEEDDRTMALLEYKLHNLQENTNDMSDTFEAACRLFDRLLSKVRTLFDMLKCDMWPLEQLLGDNMEVNQFNYKLYLILVESKLRTLLARYSQTQERLRIAPSYLSLFSTPGKTKSLAPTKSVLIVPDKKLVTLPCPTCEEDAKRRPFNT